MPTCHIHMPHATTPFRRWTPDLAKFQVKHVSVECDVRIWWHVPAQKLYLAALDKQPHVHWDLELELCCCALPDCIEDGLTSRLVRVIISRFLSFEDPLMIEMKDIAQTQKVLAAAPSRHPH